MALCRDWLGLDLRDAEITNHKHGHQQMRLSLQIDTSGIAVVALVREFIAIQNARELFYFVTTTGHRDSWPLSVSVIFRRARLSVCS